MTRVVTARVADDQYDWLAESAIHFHNGDLSKALRDALTAAMSFERVLSSRDPLAELAEMIRRRQGGGSAERDGQ